MPHLSGIALAFWGVFATAAVGSAQRLVRDIHPPITSPSTLPRNVPDHLADLHGLLLFQGRDEYGAELWRSDGTPAGTWLLKDLAAGPGHGQPIHLTVAGRYAYFVCDVPGLGREVWRTDGTVVGTILLVDAFPGEGSTSWPGDLTAVGDRLFFVTDDGRNGRELWSSDGTPLGTRMVVDLRAGPEGSHPLWSTAAGGRLFFVA